MKIIGVLTIAELDAVSSLSAWREIVIKPADKRGAIVIMDTKKYEDEILKQYAPELHFTWVKTRIKHVVTQAAR